MTAKQRAEFRHSLESVLKTAEGCAKHFRQNVIVYRANNGFWMHGRETWLRKEGRPWRTAWALRVHPNGRIDKLWDSINIKWWS